jgi:tetratricopeptide (TPR) repeat protein
MNKDNFKTNKTYSNMSSIITRPGIKILFVVTAFCSILISCQSGGEKRAATSNTQEKAAVQDSGNAAVSVQPGTQAAAGQQQSIPGQVQPKSQVAPGPDRSAKHQTVHLHPTNRDPNDPNSKMLNAYAKNKVNSTIIPFQKGSDPNIKASQDFFMNGSRKAKEGDNEGAIDDFTKSLALVKNATVYMRRGYCYLLLGDYQSAIIDENEAIKMAPILDKAYFARAVCRFEMKDFKLAEEDLNKYIETDKTSALAYNYLAAVKFMQKNFKEALDSYDQVAKLDPVFPDVYTNRGMMRHNLGDLKGAIADYTLALKQNQSNPTAYNNKGAAELTLKDYQAALSDFTMAIKYKEDYADAYDNRGKARNKLGDLAGACDDWHKAYSLGLEDSKELIIKYCK